VSIAQRLRDLASHLDALDVRATHDPRRMGALMAEHPAAVLVGQPDITGVTVGGRVQLRHRLVVASSHPDPMEALDRVLAVVQTLLGDEPGLEGGRPVTWQSPSGGEPAVGYELRLDDLTP
jgi:hypothetical protein